MPSPPHLLLPSHQLYLSHTSVPCLQGPGDSGRYMGPSEGGNVYSSSVAIRQDGGIEGEGGGEREEESLKILGLVREWCAYHTHHTHHTHTHTHTHHTHSHLFISGVVLWCNG